MKKILLFLAISALVLAVPGIAAADTACFDWSCNVSTGACTFDFSCSSASPFIWKYRMDFGDGSSTGLVGSTFASHVFTLNAYAFPTVSLTIYPWNNNGPLTASCQIVAGVPFGPPLPSSGRCST